MGEPKPMASLSSSLLARKGHAKPAMRPQGFGGFGAVPSGVEDLGWNDMGHEPQQFVHEDIAQDLLPQPLPLVLRQREQLADELDVAPAEPAPEASMLSIKPRRVADATVARISREAGAKTGKAAFTLRLAPERHLRLRLACAVRHCSAQILVTEALDRFLDTLPQVEELARRLPAPENR